MNADTVFTRKEFSEELGIAVSAVRSYENTYSLEIKRNDAGHRLYDMHDLHIYKQIIQLKKDKISNAEIKKLIKKINESLKLQQSAEPALSCANAENEISEERKKSIQSAKAIKRRMHWYKLQFNRLDDRDLLEIIFVKQQTIEKILYENKTILESMDVLDKCIKKIENQNRQILFELNQMDRHHKNNPFKKIVNKINKILKKWRS